MIVCSSQGNEDYVHEDEYEDGNGDGDGDGRVMLKLRKMKSW
jgi:hypothetical protein